MRLIFMGNPDFAVPSLQRIADSRHDLVAVVTNPARPVGRGRKMQLSAVARSAQKLDLLLIQPESLNDETFDAQLTELKPDLLVVVAFRILPRMVLAIPALGSINLHGSLLPQYRGAAPIQWALINGDSETGLTTFLIKPKVDTGDILDQVTVTITPDDDFGSLSQRMQEIGADLLLSTVEALAAGRIKPRQQDQTQVTSAPKITKDICRIDWSGSAVNILNLIRGLSPMPAAFTTWQGKRLKIFAGRQAENKTSSESPGTIIGLQTKAIQVQTGSGILEFTDCQLEGKQRLTSEQFLRGSNIQISEVFGV